MAYETLIRLSDLLFSVGITISTLFTVFLFTLPTQYDPYGNRKQHGPRDGQANENEKFKGTSRDDVAATSREEQPTVQIVVLGDIGRSPRMQYHAISFAKHGGDVQLIGYRDSELHPDIAHNHSIKVIPLVPTPSILQSSSKALFLLLAPLKVLWQVWTLYHTLGYRVKPAKYMLVQNPPSIPTLAICSWMSFVRCSKLVIDWHNFGYTVLALRLGLSHPLVRISRSYETIFARQASAHFAVTDAMVHVLKTQSGVTAQSLHDRPATQFKPLSAEQRRLRLTNGRDTRDFSSDILAGRWKLLVSSTSWTSDEDFSILLDALQRYSLSAKSEKNLPKLLAIITGKGPQKGYYLAQIRELNQQNKLQNVIVATSWLSTEDYASLLGAADLGVSLHTSSSGVDLPMKVVDMFGAGLPVVAAKFDALPELVKDGMNGRYFSTSQELAALLRELFGEDPMHLEVLKGGALQESKRRWEDEWDPVAGKFFQLIM